MSFRHGIDAELWLDGADVSEWFNSLDLNATTDTAETPRFKRRWKTHLVGMTTATVEGAGLYDPNLDNVYDTLAVESGAILTTAPAGMESVGDLCRLSKVKATAYAETAPIGDVVGFSWSVLADGPVGFGRAIKPLAEVSTNASGSTLTGPVGGTSNGAIAHLHVTAVTDDVDVKVEHSTNQSDWDDLLTFTNADAVGAERVEVSGTVNRYLRAAWEVSGSATIGVAIARL